MHTSRGRFGRREPDYSVEPRFGCPRRIVTVDGREGREVRSPMAAFEEACERRCAVGV
jgi:hypothetical protein